ncbi:unnamed protein product [Diabrotica balteata]|uniref:Alkylated DNA repair protein AlkB homologue 8 N-terminal domain-containing protein n=1 Tax=Diabrotica balteata TaxID=107213 RepID=A0A9N9XKJ1_DIABA|nr:unnamed protein product [Diabrotica balteata]
MKLNKKKTKTMVISKRQNRRVKVNVDGTDLERVARTTYLGSYLDETWDHSLEIRIHLEKARTMFYKMQKVLCNRQLGISLRTRILKCYVFSTLLYVVEAWTITEVTQKIIQAFQLVT